MKIIFTIVIFFFSLNAHAHQPKLITHSSSFDKPHEVIFPEISKAHYGKLDGEPHYYIIKSDKEFLFYTGILSPKRNENYTWLSIDIINENKEIIFKADGKNFKWWPWYEKYGKKWYWVGPEFGSNFKSNNIFAAGDYYIKIFNKKNKGNYVLATGDIEKFGPFVIAKLPFILPKINKKFWDKTKCKNLIK